MSPASCLSSVHRHSASFAFGVNSVESGKDSATVSCKVSRGRSVKYSEHINESTFCHDCLSGCAMGICVFCIAPFRVSDVQVYIRYAVKVTSYNIVLCMVFSQFSFFTNHPRKRGSTGAYMLRRRVSLPSILTRTAHTLLLSGVATHPFATTADQSQAWIMRRGKRKRMSIPSVAAELRQSPTRRSGPRLRLGGCGKGQEGRGMSRSFRECYTPRVPCLVGGGPGRVRLVC